MAKSPAFQTYASDYYIDTNAWTVDEVGIYQRLLLTEWVNGGLPNDEKRLSRIAGCSLKKFQKAWVTVSKKFKNGNFLETKSGSSISIDSNLLGKGYLINLRMEEVRQNQIKYSESRRNNVSARYKDKSTYEPTHEEHMNLHTPRSSSSTSSSTLKNKEKNKDIARSGKPKRAIILVDDDFWKEVKNLYSWLDIDEMVVKMKGYQLTPKGKDWKMTRGSVIRWLNKQDKPLDIQRSTKPIESVKYVDRDGSVGEWGAKQPR